MLLQRLPVWVPDRQTQRQGQAVIARAVPATFRAPRLTSQSQSSCLSRSSTDIASSVTALLDPQLDGISARTHVLIPVLCMSLPYSAQSP